MQLKSLLQQVYRNNNLSIANNDTSWLGPYDSCKKAEEYSVRYGSEMILNKVKKTMQQVKEGKYLYERDSVGFNKDDYSWPLLTCLIWITSREKNNLNIVDFGGSLGSTYIQNRKFLSHIKSLTWNIIEMKRIVAYGKKLEDSQLKFYYTLQDYLMKNQANVILFSASIQYLEFPYMMLDEVIKSKFKYIIIDRTYFLENELEKIMICKVPNAIFQASLTMWMFNKQKFTQYLSKKYELIADFQGSYDPDITLPNINAVSKGFLFKRKK